MLAPGARAATTDEVVRHADIIVLAVPTHRFRELPPDLFAGKILVDAMNYWEPVDGDDPELTAAPDGTSIGRAGALPLRAGGQEPQPARLPPARRDPAPEGSARPHRDRRGRRRPPRRPRRSCGSSTGSGSTPSTPDRSKNGVALEPDGSPIAATYTADELSKLVSR